MITSTLLINNQTNLSRIAVEISSGQIPETLEKTPHFPIGHLWISSGVLKKLISRFNRSERILTNFGVDVNIVLYIYSQFPVHLIRLVTTGIASVVSPLQTAWSIVDGSFGQSSLTCSISSQFWGKETMMWCIVRYRSCKCTYTLR